MSGKRELAATGRLTRGFPLAGIARSAEDTLYATDYFADDPLLEGAVWPLFFPISSGFWIELGGRVISAIGGAVIGVTIGPGACACTVPLATTALTTNPAKAKSDFFMTGLLVSGDLMCTASFI